MMNLEQIEALKKWKTSICELLLDKNNDGIDYKSLFTIISIVWVNILTDKKTVSDIVTMNAFLNIILNTTINEDNAPIVAIRMADAIDTETSKIIAKYYECK